MADIEILVAKVKNQRVSQLVKKKYHCEKCDRSMVRILPMLYTGTPQCSCGEQMKEI